MYLVDTRAGHPNLTAWKYPLPGDAVVTTIQRVVIDLTDLAAPRVVRLQMPPDQHRSTLCDDVACRGEWGDVQWSPDATTLAFVSTSRDHKQEQLRVADAATGAIRDVLSESVSTFFESGNGRINWRYLPASNEVIWFSERDNWGQLYLYDLDDRRAEAPDHDRRGERHAAAARRREEPRAVLPRRRQGEGARSLLQPSLSHRLRRPAPRAPDAGGREPRRVDGDVGPLLRRQLLDARRCRRSRCCATRRARWSSRSRPPTSRSSWPPAGSRRSRSR